MDLEKGHFGLKTVVVILVSAITFTFSLTTIYWRFGQTEIHIEELKQEIQYNRERDDKLRGRLEKRVEILEEPNSDKQK